MLVTAEPLISRGLQGGPLKSVRNIGDQPTRFSTGLPGTDIIYCPIRPLLLGLWQRFPLGGAACRGGRRPEERKWVWIARGERKWSGRRRSGNGKCLIVHCLPLSVLCPGYHGVMHAETKRRNHMYDESVAASSRSDIIRSPCTR